MSGRQQEGNSPVSHTRADIWIPAVIGIAGLAFLVLLAARNPEPSPFQLRIYVPILALSAAAFAAVVPGVLQIRLSSRGIALRAAGAIAVFMLVLWYEPAHEKLASAIGVDRNNRKPDASSNPKPGASTPAVEERTQNPPASPLRAADSAEDRTTHGESPSPFTGQWIGNVRQYSHASYRILLEIRSMQVGEFVGRANYPGLCTARWRLDSVSGTEAQFRELADSARCETNQRVRMTLSGATDAALEWVDKGVDRLTGLKRPENTTADITKDPLAFSAETR